ncbi:MAG TPA: nucleoside deaminase [Methylocella sp.]|nr:nucleoside deaminase [Methylocella sp.]
MSEHSCGPRHAQGHDRRQILTSLLGAGLAGAALNAPRQALAEATRMAPIPGDELFMRMAIAEAAQADFPFGAVIVRDGKVLAAGRNLGTTTNDPTAHGEMVAIRRFVASRPAGELKGTTLYTSGEPCPMCMGAILWCGIGRVVFAASIEELAAKIGQIMLTSRAVADAAPFATIAITGGVLSAEALALFSK